MFEGRDFPVVELLRERFAAVAAETSEYLKSVRPEDLERVVTYRTPSDQEWPRVMWRQFIHAVNHSTYHRGQVALMLRQHGCAPSPSDSIGFEDVGDAAPAAPS